MAGPEGRKSGLRGKWWLERRFGPALGDVSAREIPGSHRNLAVSWGFKIEGIGIDDRYPDGVAKTFFRIFMTSAVFEVLRDLSGVYRVREPWSARRSDNLQKVHTSEAGRSR